MTGSPYMKAINVHSVANNTVNLTRREILSWLTNTFDVNIKRLEDLGNGAIYCQIMDQIFPGCIPINRVKFNAKSESESFWNYKLLLNAFRDYEVRKDIPVHSLIKGVFSENFRFAQWFKLFYEANSLRNSPDNDQYKQYNFSMYDRQIASSNELDYYNNQFTNNDLSPTLMNRNNVIMNQHTPKRSKSVNSKDNLNFITTNNAYQDDGNNFFQQQQQPQQQQQQYSNRLPPTVPTTYGVNNKNQVIMRTNNINNMSDQVASTTLLPPPPPSIITTTTQSSSMNNLIRERPKTTIPNQNELQKQLINENKEYGDIIVQSNNESASILINHVNTGNGCGMMNENYTNRSSNKYNRIQLQKYKSSNMSTQNVSSKYRNQLSNQQYTNTIPVHNNDRNQINLSSTTTMQSPMLSGTSQSNPQLSSRVVRRSNGDSNNINQSKSDQYTGILASGDRPTSVNTNMNATQFRTDSNKQKYYNTNKVNIQTQQQNHSHQSTKQLEIGANRKLIQPNTSFVNTTNNTNDGSTSKNNSSNLHSNSLNNNKSSSIYLCNTSPNSPTQQQQENINSSNNLLIEQTTINNQSIDNISNDQLSEEMLQRELAMLRYENTGQKQALFCCQKQAKFYFKKLRQIEELCLQLSELKQDPPETLLDTIFAILYETEEGFAIPNEGEQCE